MLGDFAKRLKEIRTSMNLTMSEFSDLGDVGATTQGAYEKESDDERRYPDVRYLLNLKSHGVDIHYLLTGEKSPDNVISPQTLEIINAYENADEDHKAIFEATAKACAVKPKGRVDKKKDDEDPPKGGSKRNVSGISAGGSIGDIIQGDNNIKSTTHNYEFLSPEEIEEINEKQRQADIKRNFKLEDIFKGYSVCENVLSQIVLIASLFGVLYLMREIATVPALTPEEQIISLIFSTLIPITFGFVFYKEIRKKIKYFFDDRREKARRRILLERF